MPEISAEIRTEVGRRAHSIRKRGALPAVLYGPGVASVPLSVSAKDFERLLGEAGETSLVTVKVEGGKTYNALIHDVAKDPLSLAPIHADFYAVRMDRPIEAKVPLSFFGDSPAVENEGGILVKVIHEIEVKALPKDLPHEIRVDLARLAKISDKIHATDISLPAGVTLRIPSGEVVALVEPPRSEAELEALAKTEAEPPAAEVKTEREAKAEAKESVSAEESAETERG